MAHVDRYVFDSYALIGYLENEPFADRIQKLLLAARSNKAKLYLHAIHLGEIYYITCREQGSPMADLAFSRIKAFPITFIDIIKTPLLLSAANYKARYPISYAAAFAAAMADQIECPLLTGDPEFKKLEADGCIAVHWL